MLSRVRPLSFWTVQAGWPAPPPYLDELAHALLNHPGCLSVIAGQLLEGLGPVLCALKVRLVSLHGEKTWAATGYGHANKDKALSPTNWDVCLL
jgi:hypothetical protein